MKQLIRTPTNELIPPVFYLKHTQESASLNRNILVTFNRDLGYALECQKGRPLYYGSEFQDPTGIAKLFNCHEEIDGN